MLDAEDTVELRALQERAYGRSGALSPAEAARLRELEDARTGGQDATGTPVGPPVAATATDDPLVRPAEPVAAADDVSAVPGDRTRDSPHRESAFASLRRHWRPVLTILVTFMVLGLGIGWLLFSDRGPAAMELTAEQQEWHDAIVASGGFDVGSVRPLREEEGVVIWFATRNDGADVCLVLGDADTTAPACTTREQALIQGVSGTVVKVVDGSQNYDIDAQLYITEDGEPAVIARSYITAPQSTSMFASQEEAEAASDLAAETGLDRRTILVVGYDGEAPIWTGVDKENQRVCLVYDGSMPDPPMVCDDSLLMAESERRLVLDVTHAGDGGMTRYEYRFGSVQGYLTVTKDPGGDDAAGE